MSSTVQSSTIHFQFDDTHTLILRDFGYGKLKTAVNGERNIGELRFSQADGQIHKINDHDFMTWKNDTVSTNAENAITRNAILAILETKYELDVHLGEIFNVIKDKLIGAKDLYKPISRDEVRVMIDLLESESKVAQNMAGIVNSDKVKDYILTPGQIRAKLDLSQRLKTCNPAVRESWIKHHGDEIKDYIKGWGKSKVLTTLSDNVKAFFKGDLTYDPTLTTPMVKTQEPPPGELAQQQPTASRLKAKNGSSMSLLDIQTRKNVKDGIVTRKNDLMASVRHNLNKIDFTKYLDTQLCDEIKGSAQEHLANALAKIDSLDDKNKDWGDALKSKLTELKFYKPCEKQDSPQDGVPFCDVSQQNITVSAKGLKALLNELTGKIIERRMQQALDRLFDSCTTTEELKSVEAKYKTFFNALNAKGPEHGLERFCAGLMNQDLNLEELPPIATGTPELFNFHLFGRQNLPNVFHAALSSLETWTDFLTQNVESWTSSIVRVEASETQSQLVERHVTPPKKFMLFQVAKEAPSLSTEETRQTENAVRQTMDAIHTGQRETAGRVGLHLDKLNLNKETVKQLDALGTHAAAILGYDRALRIVIDRLKTENPDLAIKMLKSLINAHHVVRPRKKTNTIAPGGRPVTDYVYSTPTDFNPFQAMSQAQKIIETHDDEHQEVLTVEIAEDDEVFSTFLPKGDLDWNKVDEAINREMTQRESNAILRNMRGIWQQRQGVFSNGSEDDNKRLEMGGEIAKMIGRFNLDNNVLKMSPEDLDAELESLKNSWEKQDSKNVLSNVS